MAKNPHKHETSKAAKTSAKSPNEGGAFGYVGRNLIITAVVGFVLFAVDRMNEKQGQLQSMYQEFQQLRQSGGNQSRLEELYKEIMEIQSDTSFIKKITRGYYWAVHDVAIKGSQNVRDLEMRAGKPLTREDKLAMRVGTWPLIDYVIKNSPEDAVIYLPEADSALANNSKWDYVYHPGWMSYFLYPRLCVAIGREDENPGLAERVTHVLIVQGKGYDKLKYEVPENQRVSEVLLPIDNPPTPTQP